MSWRSNTAATTGGGWITSRYAGLGVPSADIPATGDSGAGYLYNDSVANGVGEYRGVILTRPSAGEFATFESSALSLVGAPDGVHLATYQGYKDGVPYNNPAEIGGEWFITMTIGSGVNYNIGGVSSVAITASADTQRATTAGGITSLAVIATADTQRNTTIGGVSTLTITARGNLIVGDQPRFGVIRLLPSTVRIKIRVGA